MTVINYEKILIIKHGALGDIIQSFSIIRDIRDHYPHSSITLLTDQSYVKFFQRCPHIDYVIPDARAPFWRIDQQLKLKKAIQEQHFEKVFDLQNSDRSRMYRKVWLANQDWIGRQNRQSPESGLAGLINLLENSGIPVNSSHSSDLSWMLDDVNHILDNHNLNQGKYIILVPGSSANHAEKRWPHYANLADRLINSGHQVGIIVGPDETDIVKKMPLESILKDLSWFELAGVLNSAKFVVGNDTGPCHIASHLGRPGLAIFGPTTSAARSEIGRRNFKTLEVNNLRELSADTVMCHIARELKSDD
jgi:ADP-heptose:LPS heptosyltransferase